MLRVDVCGAAQEIFRIIDVFMDSSVGSLVKVMVMDGEGCNTLIRQAMFGQLKDPRLDTLAWFSKLKHHTIQATQDLPRFPAKAASWGDEHVYLMPGIAHSLKNANGQLTSELHILYFGRFWADAAPTLANNMPLPAYGRLDPMSDRLAAVLMCPQFLIADPEPWLHVFNETFHIHILN